MRRLWPDPAEVDDLAALVAAEARPAPADRPWLLVNMVSSLDGAIAVDGRSGGLAGPADKEMFTALRAVADVVLAGAGTVRAESYGPPRPTEATRAARRARGQAEVPRIATVSRSLYLDVATPLFTEAADPPIVITCAAADADRRKELEDVAELIVVGDEHVDLTQAMAELRGRDLATVTCEGGPSLNGDLLAADLVDEWALTLSPLLIGGESKRASRGELAPDPRRMRMDRILEDDDFLLTRWVRRG
jgi:riboflavin-specific deaminase-like protein